MGLGSCWTEVPLDGLTSELHEARCEYGLGNHCSVEAFRSHLEPRYQTSQEPGSSMIELEIFFSFDLACPPASPVHTPLFDLSCESKMFTPRNYCNYL